MTMADDQHTKSNGFSGDNRIIDAVQRITQTLSSTLDHAEGLRRTLEIAAVCVNAGGGSIWQHDPDKRQLVCRHVVGPAEKDLVGVAISDTEGMAGHAFQSCTARRDTNVASNPQHAHWVDEKIRHQTENLITLPLYYPGGVPVGVLQLVNKQQADRDGNAGRNAFSEADLRVLEIVANVSAMSLHNADLARQAARTEALGYVAGFAHDIYNKLASFVTGVPTLRMLLEDVFKHAGDAAAADVGGGAEAGGGLAGLRKDVEFFIGYMEHDADLLYRYARFIARLAADKPLDTRFEEADLRETTTSQAPQLQRRATDLGVDLVFEPGPPLVCVHDRLLVSSAVFNLVNNALPETVGGQVHVAVRQQDEDSGFAVVEVRDTGRGMPPAVLESILGGKAVSSKPGGSGIGTLIVKRVAELHGGRLEGESVEGKGTTLRLCLPREHPTERAEGASSVALGHAPKDAAPTSK